MIQVYSLETDLKNNPERISRTQRLTLDNSRPRLGLKGTFGLFGSEIWWKNVYSGMIKSEVVEGRITEFFYAGMDSDRKRNSIRILTEDNETIEESMYANDRSNFNRYQIGAMIRYTYILDELKDQSEGKSYIHTVHKVELLDDATSN